MTEKIKSPQDLRALRERAKAQIDLRGGPKEMQITVHMGTCGIAAGARDVLASLASELEKGAVDTVTLRQSGCAGLCDREPMLTLADKTGHDYRYGKLNAERVRRIVQEHVIDGAPVMEYLIAR